MNKTLRRGLLCLTGALLALLLLFGVQRARAQRKSSAVGFAMSTVITQSAWGPHAEEALRQGTACLAQLEERLSLYRSGSEIARINAAAGGGPVEVSGQTLALLQRAQQLSLASDGHFSITLAPLTTLWNISGEHPAVPPAEKIEELLPLADDTALVLDEADGTARLLHPGQGLDLGGIAKGYACDELRRVYLESGAAHALTSIGGNICAVGGGADGNPFRIGFRDPAGDDGASLASFLLRDGVTAVSGGYERWFEQDGVRYHHILDSRTGWPAETDVSSVGVVCTRETAGENAGTLADFLSTTLFCMGKEKTLAWMRQGTGGIGVLLLDEAGTLYVTENLKEGFRMEKPGAAVQFVAADGR